MQVYFPTILLRTTLKILSKAPRNLKAFQLVSNNKRHIRSSLAAILRCVNKSKVVEEVLCSSVPSLDSQVCLRSLEKNLLNSVCNMGSLGDLSNNSNYTLRLFFILDGISGTDATWNNRLRDQGRMLERNAHPHTLGAMLRLNSFNSAAAGIDDDVVMRYKINIKTVVYYLDGGGAWERDNIEDDERIGILPNLLSFVGTTASEDNQYIADGARLGAVYRLLCSEVHLLATIR